MIVWLASYPRSGNTFLRVILKHAFGLNTYSLYNDTLIIGADKPTSDIVGHTFLPKDWDLHNVLADKNLWAIKTHGPPIDFEKVIYIIRDGREVSISYFNYLNYVTREGIDLRSVISGDVPFGSWSDHVTTWAPKERENCLLLKFEELIVNPKSYLPHIGSFLGRNIVSTTIPSFEKLQSVNPSFFRSGITDSWKKIFKESHNTLFWTLHKDILIKYGYTNDIPERFTKELSQSK